MCVCVCVLVSEYIIFYESANVRHAHSSATGHLKIKSFACAHAKIKCDAVYGVNFSNEHNWYYTHICIVLYDIGDIVIAIDHYALYSFNFSLHSMQ